MGRLTALGIIALLASTLAAPTNKFGPCACPLQPCPVPTPDWGRLLPPCPFNRSPQPPCPLNPFPYSDGPDSGPSRSISIPTPSGNGPIRVLLQRSGITERLRQAGFQQVAVPGGTIFIYRSPDVVIQPPPILVRPSGIPDINPPSIVVQPPPLKPITLPPILVRPPALPAIRPPPMTVTPPPMKPLQPPTIRIRPPKPAAIQPPPITITPPAPFPINPPQIVVRPPRPASIQPPTITITTDWMNRGRGSQQQHRRFPSSNPFDMSRPYLRLFDTPQPGHNAYDMQPSGLSPCDKPRPCQHPCDMPPPYQ